MVQVALGARAYDIVIGRGLLASLGERIKALRPGAKTVIVTDATVAKHHLAAAEASLQIRWHRKLGIVVPQGEGSKNFATFETVCEAIIAARIERGDLVVALGGGVVGDLAGFAAASARRGLDFVQVPTTLLAQVDSSVGGKTGINSRHGKNLVGAFHQPILVIADTALLDTLPKREFRAGYAEVAKYGLLGDAAFFTWLEANWQDVFCRRARARARHRGLLPRQGRHRRARRARDRRARAAQSRPHLRPRAGSRRRLLRPAAARRGGGARHGAGVRFLRPQGPDRCSGRRARAHHLAAVGLPTHLKDVPGGVPGIDALMDLIAQDKKVKRGKLTFILVRGIGQAFVENDVNAAEVRAFLNAERN